MRTLENNYFVVEWQQDDENVEITGTDFKEELYRELVNNTIFY